MISVIIPVMPVADYPELLEKCRQSLERQSARIEVIVSGHEPEKYIRKNYLLNEGLKSAGGEIVWHCDADWTISSPDALKSASERLADVSLPVFDSIKGYLKPADGGPLVRREILEKHGPLDESITGINFTTFPFIKWCLDNTKFNIDPEFLIEHHSGGGRKKVNWKQRSRLKSVYHKVISNEKFQVPDLRQ